MKGKMMDSRKHRAIIYRLCVFAHVRCARVRVRLYISICVQQWETESDDSCVCLALCD